MTLECHLLQSIIHFLQHLTFNQQFLQDLLSKGVWSGSGLMERSPEWVYCGHSQAPCFRFHQLVHLVLNPGSIKTTHNCCYNRAGVQAVWMRLDCMARVVIIRKMVGTFFLPVYIPKTTTVLMMGPMTNVAMGKVERGVFRKHSREQGNSSKEHPSSCGNHGSTSRMLWKCEMWVLWQCRKGNVGNIRKYQKLW